MELFHKMISGFLGIPERQISSTLHLLGEGATIPFISRYRKEATGGLDEVQIEQIKEQHDKLCDIAKRKETILIICSYNPAAHQTSVTISDYMDEYSKTCRV